MENVGRDTDVSSVADKKNKKKIIIFASVFAVVVIGLVIAIVVVLNNRRDDNVLEESGDTTEENSNDQVMYTFEDITREITLKIVEADEAAGEDGEGMSIEELLNLYQEKIDSTEDARLKAMLQIEYYMVKLSQNPGEENKDEILNGVIAADKILKTSDSALRVSNVAYYYGDEALGDQYYRLANERMLVEDANNTNEDTDGSDTDGTDTDDGETVG